MFIAIFFLFVNTGPSNTALANVSLPAVRATAFAVNILVIHALGDVQAFWLLGYIGGHTNMHIAFLFVSGIILASGVVWLIGRKISSRRYGCGRNRRGHLSIRSVF